MQNENIKIFVVSLVDSHERRRNIASQLVGQGLEFEWVDAVFGRALPAEDIRRYQLNQRNGGGRPYDITPGEIGCTLSHVEVYRRILDQKLAGAIVLEDDVRLLDGFATVARFLQQRGADAIPPCSVAILGGMDGLREKSGVTSSFWGTVRVDADHRLLLSIDSWFWRTCSYYIDKSAAARLFNFNRDVRAVADEWNFFLKQGLIERILYAQPWLVSHPVGDADVSTIADERNKAATALDHSSTRIGPIRSLLRAGRRQLRRMIPNVRPRK